MQLHLYKNLMTPSEKKRNIIISVTSKPSVALSILAVATKPT
jgi:hypothetical protein